MRSKLHGVMLRVRASRFTAGVGVLAATASLTLVLWPTKGSDPVRSPVLIGSGLIGAQGRAAFVPELDAARVMGAESCKKCHAAEHAAWERTVHFRNHERINSDAGKQYSAAYGGTETCYTCHSTPQPAGSDAVVGVSCESCHTASGGDGGWFEIHSDYGHGPGMMTEELSNESAEHLAARREACSEAGMIRAEDVQALARNCYSCHIVGDEKLLQSGHKPGQGTFDLLSWMQGEVRHNFQRDQQVNAESPSLLEERDGVSPQDRKRVMLVVGKLVELEVCLRNLAAVPEESLRSDYAQGWAERADSVKDFLEDELLSVVEDEDLQAAFAAVEPIRLGRRFSDQDAAQSAADTIAESTAGFAGRHDGSELGALDELIEASPDPKGETYEP